MDLATDDRVRAVVATHGALSAVEHVEEVGSTNDLALRRLRQGAAPGLVVVADRQTAGRGRRGRRWIDHLDGPDGPANLAVTVGLAVTGTRLGRVPLAAGLAVRAAVRRQGVEAVLKWPNDVLVVAAGADPGGEAKLAGILCEHHTVAGRAVVLVGCGVNLDWRGIERDAVSAGWTSLAEQRGGPVDRGQVLADLLDRLAVEVARAVEGSRAHRDAYDAACITLGRDVRVERRGAAAVVGRAVAVDADGRLVVRTAGGDLPVAAGDTVHLRRHEQ